MRCTFITLYDECYTPAGWNYPNITRPFSILYYVLGGTAFYTINGTERTFEKGHLYILPANRLFSLREDPSDKFYSVFIHAFSSPEIHQVVDVNVQNDAFLTETLSLIRKYAKVKDDIFIRHLTDMLLSYIFEVSKETGLSLPLQMQAYIDQHFIQTFNDSDLSAQFKYSNSHLTRVFKEKYRLTPKQYAKQLLLKEAVSMLLNGASVCETAERLEFSSPENFSRFFKECYGYSPSRYVKKFKNFPV